MQRYTFSFTPEIPINMDFLLSLRVLSLANSLEHQDGGRDGDIQRVANAQHRYLDVFISCLAPLVGQSCCLSTHDNSRRMDHIRLVIERRILQLSSKDAYAVGL